MECVTEQAAMDLAVRVANARSLWLCMVTLMLDQGLLTNVDVAWMRERCMEAVLAFAASGDDRKREFGLRGARDVADLFRTFLPNE